MEDEKFEGLLNEVERKKGKGNEIKLSLSGSDKVELIIINKFCESMVKNK